MKKLPGVEIERKRFLVEGLAVKVKELNKKIERAREEVKNLPGISLTKEEQAAQLNALKKQLKVKQELLAR